MADQRPLGSLPLSHPALQPDCSSQPSGSQVEMAHPEIAFLSFGYLGKLPRELRDTIYMDAFEDTELLVRLEQPLPLPPLLRCSYALREETAEFLFKSRSFVARDPEALRRLGGLLNSEIKPTERLYMSFKWHFKLEISQHIFSCNLCESSAPEFKHCSQCVGSTIDGRLHSWARSFAQLPVPAKGSVTIDFGSWQHSSGKHDFGGWQGFSYKHALLARAISCFLDRIDIHLRIKTKGDVQCFVAIRGLT